MPYRFGRLELDQTRRTLHAPDGEINLQRRVFDLLVHLVRHRDRVVSKDELVDSVWGGAFVTDGAVQRAVSLLRGALREAGEDGAIRTVPRQGYRFCAEVVEDSGGAPDRDGGEAVSAARVAFDRDDWEKCIALFREADAAGGLGGADLERWGEAAEYLGRLDEAVVPLERAVAAHSACGAPCGAARAALRLANAQLECREVAVAGGWLRRAGRYLAETEPCHEVALLEWLHARFALFSGELEEALGHAEIAYELARELGDADVEALALLYRGLVLTATGEVRRGVELLDEAAATVLGEGLGRWTGGIVYCGVIWGCLNRGDWRRASEWTDQFTRWCETNGVCGYPGICRLHHAEVLSQRGRLADAEETAKAAALELAAAIPFIEGDAHRVLGEVRLVRGDLEGAEEAFLRSHQLGWDPNPGLGLLRLAQGRPEAALRCLEGGLASGDWSVRQRRAFVLAALVRAAVAAEEPDRARRAMAELEEAPETWDTAAAGAAVARARGELALAEDDPESAATHFREAVAGWLAVDSPCLAAETRLRLAVALKAVGDEEGASLETAAASSTYEALGVRRRVS